MSGDILFELHHLPHLYSFKKSIIHLCLQFIKDVVKNSSQSKSRTLLTKLKDIETDLFDIFCRWTFNSIQQNTFDFTTFLPTDSFIQMKDLAYYIKRFNINLEDSLISFPFEQFEEIRKKSLVTMTTEVDDHEDSYFKCSDLQKFRLQSLYKGNIDQFEKNAKKLLARYYYLGGLNNSLSTPPPILQLFLSHELFGTPINTCSPTYCSPFHDEAVFESSGSFFNFTDYKEDVVYFANPPFDDPLCTQMALKLLQDLDKKTFSLVVIIPVWDKDQQDKYGIKNFGLEFDAYNMLVKSNHFRNELFLPKNQYPFYNYFYQKYVYISNTHLINLGNPVDLTLIKEKWAAVKNSK